jgi:hypothetical protein
MKIIFFIILPAICIWLFDKTCLWLERKGWLYYRFEKPKKGIIGAGLQELDALIMPSNRHVIVAQKQEIQSKKSLLDST